MNFMELLNKLEEYNCDYDLQDVTVTSCDVNNLCFLIMKHNNKVIDVIFLEDKNV